MPMTRRTAAFAEIAVAIEARVAEFKVEGVKSAVIDAALNQHFETVGSLMGISARAAMWYAPEDLPASMAETIRRATSRPG